MPTITAHVPQTSVTVEKPTDASANARRQAAIDKIAPKAVETQPPSTVETQPVVSQEATPKSPALEINIDKGRLEQLARQEKQLRVQAEQLKKERDELKTASEGRMTREEWTAQFRKEGPTQMGLTYDELGQTYLNQGDPKDQTIRELQTKIEELSVGQNKIVSQAEEAQKQAYSQALAQIDREAKNLVTKNDAYEVTRSQGAHGAITKLIELTYQDEGILMDVEEAAQQVEAYLEEEALSLFNNNKKLKAKITPTSQATSGQSGEMKTQQTSKIQGINTLTPAITQASSKPMSRRDRAVLAFEGKLKS